MAPLNLIDVQAVISAQLSNLLMLIGLILTIIIGYFSIIKREFSIFMNTRDGTIVLGGAITVKITIKTSRYTYPLRLRADMPPGVAVTFSPELVTPIRNKYLFYKATCKSIVTIVANDTIPGNRYTIPITAIGDDGVETRNVFSLICLNPEEPV